MAINITKHAVYILDQGAPSQDYRYEMFSNSKRNIHLRWYIPDLHKEPTWYHIDDIGELSGRVYSNKEKDLENLYKESNGFLEQMDLF